MTVVLITQEAGTCSDNLAVGIASSLGLELVGREHLAHRIAERTRVGADTVHRLLEGKASLVERWTTSSRNLRRVMADEVGGLAARGDIIVQCWRTSPSLRFIPHAIRVHVHASHAARILPLALDDEAGAPCRIERHGGAAGALPREDWDCAPWPHLVLDAKRLQVDECVERVRRFAQCTELQPAPGLRAAPEDLEDARFPLDRKGEWVTGRLEVDVCGDRLRLPRSISREDAIAHVEAHLRRRSGNVASSYRLPHGVPVLF
jgi:hypothetical protein